MKDLFESVWNAPKEDVVNGAAQIATTVIGTYIVGSLIALVIMFIIYKLMMRDSGF